MTSPTFDETYNDLIAVCKAAQKGLYDLGRCREAYADEELTTLVLSVSKAILSRLPCLHLQNDAIEDIDSKYGHILTKLEKLRRRRMPGSGRLPRMLRAMRFQGGAAMSTRSVIGLESPPALLLSIEQVRRCGDDPLFLSQNHILIFKAINFVSAYKSLSGPEILPETRRG